MVGSLLGAAIGIQKNTEQLHIRMIKHIFLCYETSELHSIQHDHDHFSYYVFFSKTAKTSLRKEKLNRNTK